MKRKLLVDGTLLADCDRLGRLRAGMHRVAEEISRRLMNDERFDLTFRDNERTLDSAWHLERHLKSLASTSRFRIDAPPFATAGRRMVRRAAAGINAYLRADRSTDPPPLNRYDLYHSFYQRLPVPVRRSRMKKCLSLLDIIPLRIDGYPQLVEPMRAIVEDVVSNYSIAISEYTKADLCDFDRRVDPSRVFVVPLAADRSRFRVERDAELRDKVQSKYGLPDTYFLTVSGNDKRKNVDHLVLAFRALVLEQAVGDLHLVLTGNASFEAMQSRLSLEAEVAKRIIFAKPIDEEDLCVVYSNALCFFFMSTYEGFGLPVLEAMQCGVPVVTSNVTSLPEIVGECGILLSPHDQDALSQAMFEMLQDGARRLRMSQAGLARAADFTWDRTASEYARIFEALMA